MKLRLLLINFIILAWAVSGTAETVVLPAAMSWDVMPLARVGGHTAEVFDRDDVAFEDDLREAVNRVPLPHAGTECPRGPDIEDDAPEDERSNPSPGVANA